MTFLTAVRYGVDAAVVYHGGDTEKYLDEIDGIHAPMLMHLGEEDEFISEPAQAQIKKALAGKPNTTVYTRSSITPSLAIMGHTTMPRQHRLPTDGQGNF